MQGRNSGGIEGVVKKKGKIWVRRLFMNFLKTQYYIFEVVMFSSETHPIPQQAPHSQSIYLPIKFHHHSPSSQQLFLIQKIHFYQNKQHQLDVKHQNLQTTIADLRKLVQVVDNENQHYIEKVEAESSELIEKKERLASALKYVNRDGNHLRKCALFWKQFV